jgi:tetratricopeptide (TPR) repeat protein
MRRPARIGAALPLGLLLLAAVGCGMLPGRGAPDLDRRVGSEDLARFEERAAASPDEPYWPYRIARAQAAAGQDEAAGAALDESLRRDPLYAPALSLRSRREYEAGQHDAAIAMLEGARAAGAALAPELEAGLALHYEAAGRVEEADAIAAKLLAADIDWGRNGAVLTYLRLRGPEFASSIDIARRALDERDSAVNRNNYGIALLYTGKPEEARRQFERAVEEDPDLPGPYYNLAIVDHFYRFDTAAAKRSFARYRELSNEDPDRLEATLSRELANIAPTKESP